MIYGSKMYMSGASKKYKWGKMKDQGVATLKSQSSLGNLCNFSWHSGSIWDLYNRFQIG